VVREILEVALNGDPPLVDKGAMIDSRFADGTEGERLAALRSYGILDTAFDQGFDDLAQLAADICSTPISAVTLVDADRQWFKAKVGLDATETDRSVSFCQYAMVTEDLMVVPDATLDERFADNPWVLDAPGIRFYAGAPLASPQGHPLGALCVIDTVPRHLSDGEAVALRMLARQVAAKLELHRTLGNLTASYLRFQTVFDRAPIGMALVSLTPGRLGILSDVNAELATLLGCPAEALTGRSLFDFLDPADLSGIGGIVAATDGGSRTECQLRTARGGAIRARLTAAWIPGETGAHDRLVIQVEDITSTRTADVRPS
jgi:PAS domain S-box-containing protein